MSENRIDRTSTVAVTCFGRYPRGHASLHNLQAAVSAEEAFVYGTRFKIDRTLASKSLSSY